MLCLFDWVLVWGFTCVLMYDFLCVCMFSCVVLHAQLSDAVSVSLGLCVKGYVCFCVCFYVCFYVCVYVSS